MSQKGKRFVVLKHTSGKDVHWDFMLEWGKTLQTYRLEKAPEETLHQTADAVRIFNHPLKFLTYQGPVNRGRGSVRVIETGTYQIIHREQNRLELNLDGQILKGKFTLIHRKDNNWRFSKNNLFPDS
jgi:hypothetical protein